jgi:hypothetical protein
MLQRKLNDTLKGLGLEYNVRIDYFDEGARDFEFYLWKRHSFDSSEFSEQRSHEIVSDFLLNWASDI